MNYNVITDTHFNHRKLVEYTQRPVDADARMYASMQALAKDDVLIHLGDICIGREATVHEFIASLACQKILVRGNHDSRSLSWYMTHGWDFACDMLMLDMFGWEIILSHRPMPITEGQVNVHGHVHSDKRLAEYLNTLTDFHITAIPEVRGYHVLSLRSLIEKARLK